MKAQCDVIEITVVIRLQYFPSKKTKLALTLFLVIPKYHFQHCSNPNVDIIIRFENVGSPQFIVLRKTVFD